MGGTIDEPALEAFCESVPHCVWVAAPDGTILYLNTAGADYLRRPDGSHPKGNWIECVDPQDRVRVRQAWADAVSRGVAFEARCRLQHVQAGHRWNLVKAGPLDTARGPVRWLVTGTDIDALVKAGAGRGDSERELPAHILREHLRQAERAASVGTVVGDLDGQKGDWSDELYRILGYEPGAVEPTFARFLERVHPDDIGRAKAMRERQSRRDATELVDLRILRLDGAVRWVRIASTNLPAQNGAASRIVASVQDVTDLISAETELRLNREHLRRAQSIGGIGSAERDYVTGEIYWSDEHYRLFGLDKETTPQTQESILRVIHPADREHMRAVLAKAFAAEDAPPLDYRIVLGDGQIRWVNRTAVIDRDAEGRPLRIIITHHDVTDRKEAEAALREREAQLLEQGEQLRLHRDHLTRAQMVGGIGSADIDLVNKRSFWSDGHYRVLGLEPGKGEPGRDLLMTVVHPDDLAMVAATTARTYAGEETPPIEFRIRRPDGELHWVRRSSSIIYDDHGKPIRAIVTLVDITDRRKIEGELMRSREHLASAQRIGHIGSVENDFETGEGRWTPEMYSILGLDPSIVPTFESHLAVVFPDDRPKLMALRDRDHAGEATEPTEIRIVRPDGQIRWTLRRSEQVRAADGSIRGLIVTFEDFTDRKMMTVALQESDALLREATQAGKIGVFVHDHRTDDVYWSPEQRQIYGVGPDLPITYAYYLSTIHPDDKARISEAIERVQAPGGDGRFDVENRIVRGDGSVRWIRTRGLTSFEGQGAARRWVRSIGAVIDISDLKEIEDRLRRSETHLAQAQAVGLIGSSEFDLVSGRYYRSAQFYRILGVDRVDGEDDNVTFLNNVLPEDRGKIPPMDVLAAHRGPIPPITFRIRRSDGEIRWLRRYAARIDDDSGVPVSLIFTQQDITESRRAEERLRRSETHLTQAQSVGRSGSAEIDLLHEEHHWSAEYIRILGFDPVTVQPSGALFFNAVLPEDRDKIVPLAKLAEIEGPIAPTELRIRRPDGEIRWIRRYGAVVANAEGKPVSIVFTLHDITELKQAEDQRAELERQLAQSQKMEAVGQMTGGLAHDFNNLLAVILGHLELLEGELADAPALRDWARVCIRAAERGASLTRSLLAFARRQPLNPARIELNAIVTDMTDLLRRTLGTTVEIAVVTKLHLWSCLADAGQVQNALLNLAVNARDAMPNGGKLTIETGNVHLDSLYADTNADVRAGDYVCLSVSDTGMGMPPDVVRRVFEPFFTTKDVGKGSGLGLSMVYGFAKQSGGHVSIYSEVGHGTTVKLYLPRAQDVLESDSAAEIRQPTPVGGTETVLVVEDGDDLRELTQMQLERLGYRVFAAADAAHGLQMLRDRPEVEVLLTDIVLGGTMNGVQFAETATRQKPGLAVVFMTGYSGQMAEAAVGRFGPDSILQKPFARDDLARRIRDAIDRGPV